jgi:hypothetical protein
VAADAIVWASEHDRSEIHLGWPTVRAIVANKVAPRLLDRYLARHGYDAQQTDESERSDRQHNLWQPLDDAHDVGAHGRFDAQARASSWQFTLSRHRTALAGATLAGAVAIALVRWTRDRREVAG